MTEGAILAISGLLVLAYLIDSAGRRYGLPSVVILIVSGIALRQLLDPAGLDLKWLDPVIPVLGTIGLILIVLESSLGLSVTLERTRLIVVSASAALLGFALSMVAFTLLFAAVRPMDYASAALVAIPFAVISSAVAIPSARGLPDEAREFVVYESSLSDIIGVLVFYSWLAAEGSLRDFAIDLVGGGAVSLAIVLLAAPAMFFFINRLEGHVRSLPLIAGIVFLYATGKAVHLSPLVLVLGGGLLLNNPHLGRWSPRLTAFTGPHYDQTLKEFKGLVGELTFAVKSSFFLLLGYWTDLGEMRALRSWALAGAAVAIIYVLRYGLLRLLRQPYANALVWTAPRGLITVLLFLAAREQGMSAGFPLGAVTLVVLATSAATALARRAAGPAAAPAPQGTMERNM